MAKTSWCSGGDSLTGTPGLLLPYQLWSQVGLCQGLRCGEWTRPLLTLVGRRKARWTDGRRQTRARETVKTLLIGEEVSTAKMSTEALGKENEEDGRAQDTRKVDVTPAPGPSSKQSLPTFGFPASLDVKGQQGTGKTWSRWSIYPAAETGREK